MRKYIINIDDVPAPCEINLDGLKAINCSGKNYEYEYHFISKELLLLRVNGRNYTVKIEENTVAAPEVKNTAFSIDLNAISHFVSCKSELDLLVEKFSKNKSGRGFRKDLISPMPGSVVKINVKEGDKVKPGDVLLVLEAMKMENELKASAEAIVDKIMITEKKSVDKNDILIKLLPVENQESQL